MVFYHPGVYQDVIHANSYMTLINEIFEDVVHHHLEGSRAVGEAKQHDQGFEEASIHPEGSLPLVSLFDPYIVISPLYVQLCEVLGSGVRDLVDDIRDKGKWVGMVFFTVIALLPFANNFGTPIYVVLLACIFVELFLNKECTYLDDF